MNKKKKEKVPANVRGYIYGIFPVDVGVKTQNVELLDIPVLGGRITTALFEFLAYCVATIQNIQGVPDENRGFPIRLPKKSQEILNRYGKDTHLTE